MGYISGLPCSPSIKISLSLTRGRSVLNVRDQLFRQLEGVLVNLHVHAHALDVVAHQLPCELAAGVEARRFVHSTSYILSIG